MKRTIILSLLVVAMGLMMFMGCEDPDSPLPPTPQPEPVPADTVDIPTTDSTDTITPSQPDSMPFTIQSFSNLPEDVQVTYWVAFVDEWWNHTTQEYLHERHIYSYMQMYPELGILRATDECSDDELGVPFGSDQNYEYLISGDTIYVDYSLPDITVYEEMKRWKMIPLGDTAVYWQYLGAAPCVPGAYTGTTFYFIGYQSSENK